MPRMTLAEFTAAMRKPAKVAAPVLSTKQPVRDGDIITIWLPLPAKELMSNRKNGIHVAHKARLARQAKEMAHYVALQVKPAEGLWERARLDVTLWLQRRIDPSGVHEYLKHTIDGLQGAVIVNDSRLEIGSTIVISGNKQTKGRREVELRVGKIG